MEMACTTVSSDASYKNILTRTVVLVLKDEGFSLPTVPARRALETAEKLLSGVGISRISRHGEHLKMS